MLSEKELHELRQVLLPYLPLLEKAAASVQDQDISNYPIFVLYQQEENAGLGIPVVAGTPENTGWSVNVSTLEELATKKVVAMENVERFSSVYKTNPQALCCLVWNGGAAQIVFIPGAGQEE